VNPEFPIVTNENVSDFDHTIEVNENVAVDDASSIEDLTELGVNVIPLTTSILTNDAVKRIQIFTEFLCIPVELVAPAHSFAATDGTVLVVEIERTITTDFLVTTLRTVALMFAQELIEITSHCYLLF
jgi:hypothetical protein